MKYKKCALSHIHCTYVLEKKKTWKIEKKYARENLILDGYEQLLNFGGWWTSIAMIAYT